MPSKTSQSPSPSSSPSPVRDVDGVDADADVGSAPQETKTGAGSVQNGFTDTEETSDDGSTSTSQRRRKKKPVYFDGLVGVPMPITFDLAKVRTGEDVDPVVEEESSGQHTITWEAIVYDDSKDDPYDRFERFRSTAVAKYLDSQPIELTEAKPDRKDLRAFDSNAAIALPIKKLDLESWSGPVFTIKLQALAKMPWLRVSHVGNTDYDRRSRRRDRDFDYDVGLNDKPRPIDDYSPPRRRDKTSGMIYNKERLPKTLSGHDITMWSPPTITIKSPFLYDTLSKLIEHYPSFEGLGQRFKPKVGCDFPYPHGCIMHHLPQIKEFAYSDEPLKIKKKEDEEVKEVKEDKDSPKESEEPDDPKVLEKQKEHMKILYEYLSPLHEPGLVAYEKALKEDKPKVSFDMLWFLLKPGTEVYVRDSWTSFYKGMITYVNSEQNNYGEIRFWEIGVWFMMSDGARVGRVMSPEILIDWYDGMKEVTSLDVCPADIWDKVEGHDRRKLALERGRLFEKSLRQGYLLANFDAASATAELSNSGKVIVDHRRGKDMTGLTLQQLGFAPGDKDIYDPWDHLYLNEPWKWPAEELPRYGSNDVVVDRVSDPYAPPPKKINPRNTVPLAATGSRTANVNRDRNNKKVGEKDLTATMTDQQVSMFYPLTFGFSLKTKMWIEMDTSRLREIEPSSESMENLVIGDDELKTIKALASRLSKTSSWEADYIRGKGSGGIILLHGPPGVGKTYTVESIAEFLHLPLLALTIADIGTVETKIESELSRWLSLAEYWKCVLLIDEADIFLERRQNRDLARNGLVSAFLRRAEYFKGLLFLTTNRVGQIDDAFVSRVHVAIQYRSLTNEDLQRIWKGFFAKLARERKGQLQIAPDAKKWVLDVFGKGQYASLNGRDIRNALQTAITLAEFESEEDPDFDASEGMVVIISQKHFERVLEMSHRFHDYVAGIRMEDEKKRAHARGDRNDYLDDGPVSLPLRDRRK